MATFKRQILDGLANKGIDNYFANIDIIELGEGYRTVKYILKPSLKPKEIEDADKGISEVADSVGIRTTSREV